MRRPLRPRLASRLQAVAIACFVVSCASGPLAGPGPEFAYFVPPEPSDPWSPKIAAWQSREQALPDTDSLRAPASVSGGNRSAGGAEDLRRKYFDYRADRKRSAARDLASWIQRQSKRHYLPDGPVDHWATLEETLANDGDDCDGLELLVYHFLRDLGFGDDEVYRAIVVHPADGQHHMVTLWFEDRDDPWVIDPTGAMTTGMPRMSQVPGWVPIKVFGEHSEFTVQAHAGG